MGCRLCEVHCAVQHSLSRDVLKAFATENLRPLPRIRVRENGSMFVAVQCRHCAEPACVYACLTGAMQQDTLTGNVSLDPERCIGCWTCILACTYGAIRRDLERQIAVKCDLCPDLEVPACVANCPNEALIFTEDGAGA
jgi:carbon-monoxide dehydrogenase iron sulfur subunit